jgi:hypothetical protein
VGTETAYAKEEDKTYIVNAALYYKINKDLNLALSYAWRENASNVPTEKYADTVVTAGAYYQF